MTQNPLSYFVQALGKGDADKRVLIQHAVKANLSTIAVMDDFQLCRDLKDALPNCVVCYRSSRFEPSPNSNPISQLNQFLVSLPQDKRIVIEVNCESGFDLPRVNMWCDMIEAAEKLGWKLCVANVSCGSVKSGQGSDTNDWLNIGRRLLETIGLNPGHYIGVHNYTGPFQWLVSNGGWGDPLQPPVSIDWTKPQWHMGRDLQGIKSALKTMNVKIPRQFIIITEGTFDQMGDVGSNPSNPYRYIKSDRWRRLIPSWAGWYKGTHPEDVLADQNIWTWEKIFQPDNLVVGIHFFTYWDAGGEWSEDRVDNAPTYLRRMESYRPNGVVVTPPIDTPPVVIPPSTDSEVEKKNKLRKVLYERLQATIDALKLLDSQT